jgi:hypothetical protein
MGRWFGYRDGYDDLCRIWMSPSIGRFYAHINESVIELRNDLLRMRQLNQSPEDFGLRVKGHPDILLITARNKMRTAHTVTEFKELVSLNGRLVETPRIHDDPGKNAINRRLAREFFQKLMDHGYALDISEFGNPIIKGVDHSLIADYLDNIVVHELNMDFQPAAIARFLRETTEPALLSWDLVIPGGSSTVAIEDLDLVYPSTGTTCQQRDVSDSKYQSLLVSRKSSRVGSRGVTREGLSLAMAQKIEREYIAKEKKNPPDTAYLIKDRSPLLLLHYLDLRRPEYKTAGPWLAFGLALPRYSEKEGSYIQYSLNKLAFQQYMGDAEVIDDDEEI